MPVLIDKLLRTTHISTRTTAACNYRQIKRFLREESARKQPKRSDIGAGASTNQPRGSQWGLITPPDLPALTPLLLLLHIFSQVLPCACNEPGYRQPTGGGRAPSAPLSENQFPGESILLVKR